MEVGKPAGPGPLHRKLYRRVSSGTSPFGVISFTGARSLVITVGCRPPAAVMIRLEADRSWSRPAGARMIIGSDSHVEMVGFGGRWFIAREMEGQEALSPDGSGGIAFRRSAHGLMCPLIGSRMLGPLPGRGWQAGVPLPAVEGGPGHSVGCRRASVRRPRATAQYR